MNKLLKKIICDSFTKHEVRAKLVELKIAAWSGEEKELLEGVSRDNIEEVFKEANKDLDMIDTLVLSVALDFPEAVVSNVGRKARALFGPDLLLEFKVNHDLIGGTALVWKGKYKDYSIRARFEEKKQELKKIYSRFLE